MEHEDFCQDSKELISVIVPVYNVEKYLRECVDSIRRQTYTDLEIILVDDGSTDQSGSICDEYAAQDNRIRVIHKENGGLSDARNAGIGAANGTYISFIDSDDYVSPDMISALLNGIRESQSDIALCGYMTVTESGKPLSICDVNDEELTAYDALVRLNMDGTDGAPFVIACNKMYNKQLFVENCFPVGKLNEDAFIMHRLIDQCGTVCTLKGIYYYYRQRAGSITKRTYSARHLDCVEAYYDRYCYYRKRGGQYSSLLKAAGQRFAVEYYYEKVHFKPGTEPERRQVRETDRMARDICLDLFPQWSLGMKLKLLVPRFLHLISKAKDRSGRVD